MPRYAEDSQAGAREVRRGADADEARSDDNRICALRRRRRVAPAETRGRGGGAAEHAPDPSPCGR